MKNVKNKHRNIFNSKQYNNKINNFNKEKKTHTLRCLYAVLFFKYITTTCCKSTKSSYATCTSKLLLPVFDAWKDAEHFVKQI